MSLLERIVIDPDVVHGRPRMRMRDVLSLLASGVREAQILEDYPYLSVDDSRACVQYAAVEASHSSSLTF